MFVSLDEELELGGTVFVVRKKPFDECDKGLDGVTTVVVDISELNAIIVDVEDEFENIDGMFVFSGDEVDKFVI